LLESTESPSEFTIIKEGKAEIKFPKGNQVFYNPVQEVNRDLSVLAIQTWCDIFEKEKDNLKKKEGIVI
jgi:tRNA (guanine26-N2/guanine27-N2)-dimethyltransferase